MIRVTISGWEKGLNKVELNHLLRQHGGFGLLEAKHAVDRLLDGGSVTFEAPDPDSATSFCRSATAIGAICQSETEAHTSA